jgi:predicted metal-dependent HD superfamily phosphohydrolase
MNPMYWRVASRPALSALSLPMSHPAPEETLREHWRQLCASLHLEGPGPQGLGERLLRAWRRWPRRYHDTRHLLACVDAAHRWRGELHDPQAVAWALWFHDAVYLPWRRDNEARSAELARRAALGLGLAPAFAERVHHLVMATAHGQAPLHAHDHDADWVVDIDLGVLGQPRPVYERYARDVRREYFWVLPGAWRRGRGAVLRHFLAQPAVYRRPAFRERFEQAARANLQHELDSLAG